MTKTIKKWHIFSPHLDTRMLKTDDIHLYFHMSFTVALLKQVVDQLVGLIS